jgi:16S rRNA (uracil1498-N3)-methyltransferase
MRVHRFYTGADLQLKRDFWIHDIALLWQWNKVLRFREGQEVQLYDGVKTERLYRIAFIDMTEAHVTLVTDIERQLPARHVYLFWSLLKKDNNDLILQKATELGVSNFVPMLSERSIRDNFNMERAHKIVREASEQCGRSNIPFVREPVHLAKILDEYTEFPLYVCEQGSATPASSDTTCGVLIGPEGGWSTEEKLMFTERQLPHIGLGNFTLRAETAAIVAASKVL